METIIIDNISYYDAESVKKISPIFFKGCRNVREIIKKKTIDNENFIYGICKDNEWRKTDGSSKKMHKLLLLVDWVKENVPELVDCKHKEIKHDIEKSPDIINLTDNDKMKDDDNNILEIEVRGKREYNACYFRVKDIMEAFDMKRLSDVLVDKHTGYKLLTHYIFFNYVNDKNKIKKELFLTLAGFRRVIEKNNSRLSQKTKTIIHEWLKKFNTKNLSNYKINTKQEKNRSNIGYTYCATSDRTNCVKIGFWRGSYNNLVLRYKVYYGKNVQIFCVKTMNARLLEQKCHTHFHSQWYESELFNKEYLKQYIEFLEENKEDIVDDNMFDDDNDIDDNDDNDESEPDLIFDNNENLNEKIKELENKVKILHHELLQKEVQYQNLLGKIIC